MHSLCHMLRGGFVANKPEKNVLCLIFSDETWDMGSNDRVNKLIADFWKACREDRQSDAIRHLIATNPDCVRVKAPHELETITNFKSFKGTRTETRFKAKVFSELRPKMVKRIVVYTMPQQGPHRKLFHNCQLTLVINGSLEAPTP